MNLSGGRLEQGTQRFLVRTVNEFESLDDMAGSVIATVGGQPVYLRTWRGSIAATRTAPPSRG